MLLSDRAAGSNRSLAGSSLRCAEVMTWYAGRPSEPRVTKVLPARVEEVRAKASPVGMAVTQITKAQETCERGKELPGSFCTLMPKVIVQSHTTLRRGAYTQETRDVILSLDRATKTAPNGKQILKNVGVAMYLGAKIGFLGQNGAYTKCSICMPCANMSTCVNLSASAL